MKPISFIKSEPAILMNETIKQQSNYKLFVEGHWHVSGIKSLGSTSSTVSYLSNPVWEWYGQGEFIEDDYMLLNRNQQY